MFIKFNNKLVDVSGCYFLEPIEFNSKDPYRMDHQSPVENKWAILLQSNTHPQIRGFAEENFNTKEEADKRFAELQGILTKDWQDTLVQNIEWLASFIQHKITMSK